MNTSKKDFPLIFQNIFYDWKNNILINPIETQNYSIVQITDSYYINKFIIPDHVQICDIEITLDMFNSLQCTTNNVESKLNANEIYLVFKNETHSLLSKNTARFITIAFDIKPDSPSYEILKSLKLQFQPQDKRIVESSLIQDRITAIVSEMLEEKPYRKINLDSLITNILIFLARPSSKQVLHRKQNVRLLLPAISNYIENNFKTIVSTDEICSKFGYSHTYICKHFKEYYGFTMKEYIIKHKMEYAQNLLNSNYSVTQVSDMLCYSSPYNFSKAYKTYFGFSPTKK